MPEQLGDHAGVARGGGDVQRNLAPVVRRVDEMRRGAIQQEWQDTQGVRRAGVVTCCRPVPRSGLHVDPRIRQKEACDRSLVAVARPVQRRALLLVRRIGVLGGALNQQCLNSRRIACWRQPELALPKGVGIESED